MLTEAVPGAVDEGQEGVRRHRLRETGGVIPHRLRPQVLTLVNSLKPAVREPVGDTEFITPVRV